jgi:hypothetical protein
MTTYWRAGPSSISITTFVVGGIRSLVVCVNMSGNLLFWNSKIPNHTFGLVTTFYTINQLSHVLGTAVMNRVSP